MGIETTPDQPGNAGNANPDSNGSNGSADAAAEKQLPQSKVNEIVQREKAAMTRQYEAQLKEAADLKAELDALRTEKQKAEEAKLSATERTDRERKRLEEATAKQLAEANERATRAEARRVATVKAQHASRFAASIAAQLASPDLAEDVADRVASLIVIEDDGKGGDRLMLRMGDAEGDTEPLESGLAKLRADRRITRYLRTAGGSGAPHGGGSGGSGPMPTTLVDALVAAQRTHR